MYLIKENCIIPSGLINLDCVSINSIILRHVVIDMENSGRFCDKYKYHKYPNKCLEVRSYLTFERKLVLTYYLRFRHQP